MFDFSHALVSLRPGAQWVFRGDTYDGIEWLDESQELPTEEELTAEVERLQAEYDAAEYRRLRALEYPDFRDYLDGLVKGDQDQIDAYINACLAVKAKYPKPE
jgi:tRNA A37 N6-isopentenylltransferase MiaA